MRTPAFFLLVALFTSNAFAASFTVNSTIDAVDSAPGNGVCVTAAGACTLRAAVQEANALAGADTINIPAGTYHLSLAGTGENVAATGDLDITQELTITGTGASSTIIDCGALDRGFDIIGNIKTTFSKLWIKNCSVSGTGGGIQSVSTDTLTLSEVKFSNNRATDGAGLSQNGALVISDSIFDQNYATSSAGAIYKVGNGNVTISGTDITSNYGGSAYGGYLIISTDGTVSMSTTDITDNIAVSYAAGLAVAVGAGGASLSSVTVKRNTADSIAGAFLQTTAGPITITNSEISNNSARSTGGSGFGGLYAIATTNLTITGTSILNNSSWRQYGGGGLISTSGSVNISNSHIIGNTALDAIGGLIILGTTGVTLTDTEVSENLTNNSSAASTSAGGFVAIVPTTASLTFTRVSCKNNISFNGAGGCFYLSSGSGPFNIDSSTFDGNYADTAGGAFYAVSLGGAGPSTIVSSTISNNSVSGAGFGGGLVVSASHQVNVTNSTFSGNFAGAGAATYYAIPSGISFKNCTFAENKASIASAIGAVAGVTTLDSTIISDGNAAVLNCAGVAPTSAGNNISDDGTCNLVAATDRASTDPLLQPLADNGGPTLTHAIIPGSPAMDWMASCIATDQRGVARPFDGDQNGTNLCDVGAFEANDACPSDPAKTVVGVCGCGVADDDANGNSIVDCRANADSKAQAQAINVQVSKLKRPTNAAETTTQKNRVKDIKLKLAAFKTFTTVHASQITVSGSTPLAALVAGVNSSVKKALKYMLSNFASVNKPNAKKALKKYIKAM